MGSFFVGFVFESLDIRKWLYYEVIGIKIFRLFMSGLVDFGCFDWWLDWFDDVGCDLILEVEYIFDNFVVMFGLEVFFCVCIDKLCGDFDFWVWVFDVVF